MFNHECTQMHTKSFGTVRRLSVAPASGGSVQASRLNLCEKLTPGGTPKATPESFRGCYTSTLTVASKLATSATLSICTFLSMRFMKPLSAVPGPSSMNRVKPCASR